uniref:Inositol hexakisphosphate and diphosphoinositol-pentakisphosphate kinase n=1 Tax=Ceratitis capitata TaxID=7213 RepID=W8AI30_CERCA
MANIGPCNDGDELHFVLGSSPLCASRAASVDDFQLSCSAPATILSSEFRFRRKQEAPRKAVVVKQLRVESPTNSPTASTLKLCKESDERQLQQQAISQQKYANELCGGGGGGGADIKCVSTMKTASSFSLPTVQSAPVMIDVENPFKFTQQAQQQQPFVNKFSTINEFDNALATNTAFSSPLQCASASACDFDTLTKQQPHAHTHAQTDTQHAMHTTITNDHHFDSHNPHYNQRIRRQHSHQTNKQFNRQQSLQQPHTLHATPIPDVIVTLSSSSTDMSNMTDNNNTNQLNSKLTPTVPTAYDNQPNTYTNTNTTTTTTTIITTYTTTTTSSSPNINANMSASMLSTTTTTTTTTTAFTSASASKSTPSMPSSSVVVICTASTADGNATPVSSSSSVSSRRQRHGIAGQMSYMKMLGFGGFSKKMATSSSSLFSTAVISGSSSAPNLRDMIPCAVSSSGFGGVPPIRPLETLHNALSLKQLDQFLHKMTTSPLFKTPASSPPKHPSTPQQNLLQNALHSMCSLEAATSYVSGDSLCHCQEATDADQAEEQMRESILQNAMSVQPAANTRKQTSTPESAAQTRATEETVATAAKGATTDRFVRCHNPGAADANATVTGAQPTTGGSKSDDETVN